MEIFLTKLAQIYTYENKDGWRLLTLIALVYFLGWVMGVMWRNKKMIKVIEKNRSEGQMTANPERTIESILDDLLFRFLPSMPETKHIKYLKSVLDDRNKAKEEIIALIEGMPPATPIFIKRGELIEAYVLGRERMKSDIISKLRREK